MRIGSIVVAALLALTAGSCGKSEKAAARKLRKMDFHAKVDDRGRLQLTFRLFDAKHEQMPVTGAYTAEVTKLDGALLCKASGELAPSDFSDKGAHKPQWVDASCPADPGADELKLNVTLTVKGGAVDAEAKGKEKEKDEKGAKEAKDAVIERSVTVAVRTLYERPPVKPPAAGSGSGAGSAAGSDSASGSAAGSNSASGSAGSAAGSNSASSSAAGSNSAPGSTGSASVPAEKPPTPSPAPAPAPTPAPKGSAS